MHTVRSLLEASTPLLAEHGSTSPRLDADLLLGEVLTLARLELYMQASRPVDETELARFRALIARRCGGEPIAYIFGRQGFWSLDLHVDARVLIPRPETERVVELALAFARRFAPSTWRIVDVGTGSGALALSLAVELPESRVLAVDISADALAVARSNAERVGVRDRVSFVCADLLAPLASRPASVDVVVSNPPYIGDDDPTVEAAVVAHEPRVALFAGTDGLAMIRRLIPAAHEALAPGGALFMEIGASQGPAVLALAERHFETCSIERDYAGLDRVLVAFKAGALSYAPSEPTNTPTPVVSAPEAEPSEVESSDDDGPPPLPVIDLDSL